MMKNVKVTKGRLQEHRANLPSVECHSTEWRFSPHNIWIETYLVFLQRYSRWVHLNYLVKLTQLLSKMTWKSWHGNRDMEIVTWKSWHGNHDMEIM